MKIIHLSDLHLGKRVHEFSMLDDQRYILKQILEHVAEEHSAERIAFGGKLMEHSGVHVSPVYDGM